MADTEIPLQKIWIRVSVQAEDEDDQCYKWQAQVPSWQPLQGLRAQWAEAHGVIEDAVGFELHDCAGELDLTRTPLELFGPRVAEGGSIQLQAVPADTRFAEGAVEALPPPAVQKKAPAAAERNLQAEPPVQAGHEPHADQQPTATASENAAAPASGASGAEPPRKRGRPAKVKAEPEGELQAQAREGLPPTKRQAGGQPGDDETVVFSRPNPKRFGTKSFERYERYMNAKTPREAIELGALRSDIKYDFERGYLSRRA